jgi:hypothetical protein
VKKKLEKKRMVACIRNSYYATIMLHIGNDSGYEVNGPGKGFLSQSVGRDRPEVLKMYVTNISQYIWMFGNFLRFTPEFVHTKRTTKSSRW